MGNTWIDLPVVAAMEYFSGIIGTAYKWASRYAYLFGVIGIAWSGIKVVLSRMTVKDLWWDTLFKWVGFILLITIYPSMTTAFAAIGNEIGYKAGGGREVVISGLKGLRDSLRKDLQKYAEWEKQEKEWLAENLESSCNGYVLDVEFQNSKNYMDYLNKVEESIKTTKWSRKKDQEKALDIVQDYKEHSAEYHLPFGAQTLACLEKILIEKNEKDKKGNIIGSYVDIDIYLKDSEGEDTPYVSPSALLRVALLSCQLMNEKMNTRFRETLANIEGREDRNKVLPFDMTKVKDSLEAHISRIPQVIMVFFCCIVLILATVFAEIQYVMTVLEYTIIVGIGAIFIPLMLFDGTKDIPKKLIPVFTSFFIKFAVITICIMFVFYLMIQNCLNTITDDGGMNWVRVGEIVFESMLAYILTQNAPKIAQTILTGQPQLSMGEALQAGATTLGTAAAMTQAPGAAAKLGARGINKLGEMKTNHDKRSAASSAAKAELGDNAGFFKRHAVGAAARGAVFTKDLADRVKAKYENGVRSGGTGFSVLDKALQTAGLTGSGGAGGSGGSGGGASAYKQTGQGSTKDHENEILSTSSNPDFKTATKYDERTGQQRAMTPSEWHDEKVQQGQNVGSSIGKYFANESQKKVDSADVAQSNSKTDRMS